MVINRDNNERYVKIPVWETCGIEGITFEKIMMTSRDGFSSDVYEMEIENGKMIEKKDCGAWMSAAGMNGNNGNNRKYTGKKEKTACEYHYAGI